MPEPSIHPKESTRDAILRTAELQFAAKGYRSARLEDVASDVGVTRTAVIYHFKDKETLYQAVLESLFTQLNTAIGAELDKETPFFEKIESAVSAWVQFAGKRPSLMRLFMREVADSQEGLRSEVSRYVDPMFARLINELEKGKQQGLCREVDSVQFWSILAGATMFFIMDAPLLTQEKLTKEHIVKAQLNEGSETSDSYQASVDSYNRELIRVMHGLLAL